MQALIKSLLQFLFDKVNQLRASEVSLGQAVQGSGSFLEPFPIFHSSVCAAVNKTGILHVAGNMLFVRGSFLILAAAIAKYVVSLFVNPF